MIGRGQVANIAPPCGVCGVLVADADVIRYEDGRAFCSSECAPDPGHERTEDADDVKAAS